MTARLISFDIFLHCKPYALFIIWKIDDALQTFATSSILSGDRGAKQLVVVNIH